MDEREALYELRRGNDEAIGWFIERYGSYVTTIINNMVLPALSPSDAEEAAADTFVALWRGAASVPEGSVRAYLAGIARNKARSALRRRHRFIPLSDSMVELTGAAPDEEELVRRTREAVLSMTEPDREIFLRHYFYGQTVADIALALDMNTNTVKSRLRRGRDKLRAELTEED